MIARGLRWQPLALLGALPCVLLQCETVTDGPALTVVSVSAQSSTASSGGNGGDMAGSGGAGAAGGADATTTSTASAGGNGGAGGSPIVEKPVNGCLKSMATDLTGMTSVSINNPLLAPFCLIVSEGTTVSIDGTGQVGGPMILGGELLPGGVKVYDKSSPIQPSCYNANATPTFNANSASCYNGSSWSFTIKQAYPFYNNSNAVDHHGAVYVVD